MKPSSKAFLASSVSHPTSRPPFHAYSIPWLSAVSVGAIILRMPSYRCGQCSLPVDSQTYWAASPGINLETCFGHSFLQRSWWKDWRRGYLLDHTFWLIQTWPQQREPWQNQGETSTPPLKNKNKNELVFSPSLLLQILHMFQVKKGFQPNVAVWKESTFHECLSRCSWPFSV